VATIRMTPEGLAVELRRLAKASPQVLERGLKRAARRGQAHMPGKTPTDQGQLRNSWRVIEGAAGVRLENDAPHAGIVEAGARPHPVSREGIEALTGWAMRKFGLPADEAEGLAFAIAARIKKEGQAPTYFVRAELEKLASFAGEAVLAELAKEVAR
jgi:hypothetical protein